MCMSVLFQESSKKEIPPAFLAICYVLPHSHRSFFIMAPGKLRWSAFSFSKLSQKAQMAQLSSVNFHFDLNLTQTLDIKVEIMLCDL